MKIFVALLLIICLFDMPYGYYQFVRLTTAVYFCYELLKNSNTQHRTALIILIIIFQPFIKLSLGRMLWNIVDIIVALWLLLIYSQSEKLEVK